ncbi:MAG: hypothetical protein WC679_01495 [Bacteroidales bacterium]|jgi:hypothetical protein
MVAFTALETRKYAGLLQNKLFEYFNELGYTSTGYTILYTTQDNQQHSERKSKLFELGVKFSFNCTGGMYILYVNVNKTNLTKLGII